MDKFFFKTARLFLINKTYTDYKYEKMFDGVIVSSFIFCSRRKVCEKLERKIPRPSGRQEDD
jgi:hypothetical protein